MTSIKKYLRKLNNIQRTEYEEKFRTFTFKITFSTKKLIIIITSKTRIIITFIKSIILILFIKIKIDVDVKKLMCYNYNQIEHIKRDYSQSNKKVVRIHVIKMNNNDNNNL